MAEPTTTPVPSVGRAAFTFILIMVAFDFLAFGIIAPVLPDLIRSFEGGDFGRASSITGYFGFAWATMQFIFSPLLGAWSDRFGRRPVILISCFGLSITGQIGRAHSELQSRPHLVCRLLLEKKKILIARVDTVHVS